ncbi:response regulator transcription factor [Desulforhopalus singaporensis]|uniref:DNA-binding response regulator, NarL/FixJ family, contains REC and HTH domains n=1 Tax=Desulforhopalus singaporensis TaxID=91360 RepID=A0A1H0MWS1_9BACT|nr:response regulator transcription factor [Desulforhopalus singaporensis]SDO84909.1 DNA-binding response regulator, NarL/FixJ family, contains REC and HTH domains [Desulforhopalus singaporensis]
MGLLLSSSNVTVRKRWLEGLDTSRSVYQASTIQETLDYLSRFNVGVLLLHRTLVDTEQLRKICNGGSECRVIVLSDRPDDMEGLVCLQQGCVGYANTYISPQRLKAAVQAVNSGLVWVNSSLMTLLVQGVSAANTVNSHENSSEQVDNPILENLSAREYQIAQLVAQGWKNGRIAKELNITERTVKAHLSSIYSKTHTTGRLNLALLIKKS